MDNNTLNCSSKVGYLVHENKTCYCYFPNAGDQCETDLLNMTYFKVLFFIHVFLFDIIYLFITLWGIVGLVDKKKKSNFSILTLIFVIVGNIFRIISSVDYFGWLKIYSLQVFLVFHWEAYCFWVIAWVFIFGFWMEISISTKLMSGFQLAPVFDIVTGLIFFAIFQLLVVLQFVLPTKDDINIIFNLFMAIVSLFVIIAPLVLGNILLGRVTNVKAKGNTKKREKIVRKTKAVMYLSSSIALAVITLIIYSCLELTFNLYTLTTIIFQLLFRVEEIIAVSITVLVSTGRSISSSFSSVFCGKISNDPVIL